MTSVTTTVGPIVQSIISTMANTSTAIRPSDLTVVHVQMAIVKTLQLSNSGILSISAALILTWVDPRLTFNCAAANFVNIPASYLWSPSIVLINCPDNDSAVSPDENAVAFVSCIGTVNVIFQRPYTATCKFDLTSFPFDSQSCTLSFISFEVGPSLAGVNFSLTAQSNASVDTTLYQPAGEFKLISSLVVAPAPNACVLGVCFSCFQITLNYQRNSSYYVLTIILPAVLLTLLISVAIVIPSENSVKISMTASLMVSLYVLQQNVTRLLPAGATTSLCAIGSFASLFLGCIALVCTTLSVIVRMQKPPLGPRLERWLQRFDWLLCVCTATNNNTRVHSKVDVQDHHESSIQHSQPQPQTQTQTQPQQPQHQHQHQHQHHHQQQQQQQQQLKEPKTHTNAPDDEDTQPQPLTRTEKLLTRMLMHMEMQAAAERKAEDSRRTQAAREKGWRLFDSVSNSLIFIVYLIGALVCILLYQWQV